MGRGVNPLDDGAWSSGQRTEAELVEDLARDARTALRSTGEKANPEDQQATVRRIIQTALELSHRFCPEAIAGFQAFARASPEELDKERARIGISAQRIAGMWPTPIREFVGDCGPLKAELLRELAAELRAQTPPPQPSPLEIPSAADLLESDRVPPNRPEPVYFYGLHMLGSSSNPEILIRTGDRLARGLARFFFNSAPQPGDVFTLNVRGREFAVTFDEQMEAEAVSGGEGWSVINAFVQQIREAGGTVPVGDMQLEEQQYTLSVASVPWKAPRGIVEI